MTDLSEICFKITKFQTFTNTSVETGTLKMVIIKFHFGTTPADVRVEEKEKKGGKVPGFEKRDQKIVEIEKCRNCPCSDMGPWKCFCRI